MFKLPKLKVYVQLLNNGCVPRVSANGDWIDLRAAEDVNLEAPQVPNQYILDGVKRRDVIFDSKRVPLGVRMLLPKGTYAHVLPRSGTYDKFHVIMANHMAVIDWTYNGPKDEWLANLIAFGKCSIKGGRPATEEDRNNKNLTIINDWVQGDRICQFRISLSQFASFKDKLRWLFSSGIELVLVDNIDTVVDRGGFNKSGVK